MALGFKIKYYWYHIGTGDFLHAFFSTVAVHLENGNWGSRFPFIMNELYQGELSWQKADSAIEELNVIKQELQAFAPDKVIWDIDDFITIFLHALEKAKGNMLKIERKKYIFIVLLKKI